MCTLNKTSLKPAAYRVLLLKVNNIMAIGYYNGDNRAAYVNDSLLMTHLYSVFY